jgi:hypothetical protein
VKLEVEEVSNSSSRASRVWVFKGGITTHEWLDESCSSPSNPWIVKRWRGSIREIAIKYPLWVVCIYIHDETILSICLRRDYSQYMLSENRSWTDLLREKNHGKKENHIRSDFLGSDPLISAVITIWAVGYNGDSTLFTTNLTSLRIRIRIRITIIAANSYDIS